MFFGLTLIFPKTFTGSKAVHKYFLETYFEEMPNYGYYWLLPESRKDVVNRDFGYSIHNVPSGRLMKRFSLALIVQQYRLS